MEEDKNKELSYIFSLFNTEENQLKIKLKQDISLDKKAEAISKLNQIKFSKELLRRCFEYDILPKAIWRRVPEPDHQFSEFRILEDLETEDRKVWKELEYFRLTGGEVVIG